MLSVNAFFSKEEEGYEIKEMEIPNYHLVISEASEDTEWDFFVGSIEGGHHVQTSLWAQIKITMGWKPVRIIARDTKGIVAGVQMLVRPYLLFGKVGYITKGPIFIREDGELIDFIIKVLLNECRNRNINILVIQPPNNAVFMINLLQENNFQQSSVELAPTASILIDLSLDEDKLLSQIHKSTRNNIRFGLKNGVSILEGSSNSLKLFYDLHINTSKRQNFLPYSYKYFETMQKILEPKGYFQLMFVKYNYHLVSALILIPFNGVVITKLCGWSGLYEKLKPNDVMYWGAIQWAKSHGYRFLDLEGINREGANLVLNGKPLPEQLVHSPDQIKYKFGGKIVLYPMGYDYVFFQPYRQIFRKLEYNERKHNLVSKTLDFLRKR